MDLAKTLGAILFSILLMQTVVVPVGFADNEKSKESKNMEYRYTNNLINETSPYLLQHAHNPVDWYPWTDEAFDKAGEENKPIFLSIGYSTCHWCHVMERESFTNEEIAGILNEHFISIKVDREERPDIDKIYLDSVHIMAGRGGWPLSVFLTPEGKPFYGGTYFPPEDSFGRPGFKRILLNIAEAWDNKSEELIDSAGRISEALSGLGEQETEGDLSTETLDNAYNFFRSRFDSRYGGFSRAPKFPQATNLSMLLSYLHRNGNRQALQMVEKTLNKMAKGGIYDHLGGGFHRYSTDAKWLVPHFEKMLYDQALLSKTYIQAYQITNNPDYAKTAREVFDYVLRDLTDEHGGFYSAEDADSEGVEGKFYLWRQKEIIDILGKKDAEIFNAYYNVTERGNFEKQENILNIISSVKELASRFKKAESQIEAILNRSRSKLFEARAGRIRPSLDDKVITAWNGLMISSLSYGGAVLGEQKYIDAARRSADFILNNLHKNGRLMRYYRSGKVVGKAFLTDYAFMITGLLDLYEATFDAKWLRAAKQLAEEMIELFQDDAGFFLTGKDSEKLIARAKPSTDGAVPSGNSGAALALLKLGHLTMNKSFTAAGTKTIELFSEQMVRSPGFSSLMLTALDFQLGPRQEIVIAGNLKAEDTQEMIKLIHKAFLPNAVVLLHEQGDAGKAIEEVVPFVKYQKALNNKATAYICENYACREPVNSISSFKKQLANITTIKKVD